MSTQENNEFLHLLSKFRALLEPYNNSRVTQVEQKLN